MDLKKYFVAYSVCIDETEDYEESTFWGDCVVEIDNGGIKDVKDICCLKESICKDLSEKLEVERKNINISIINFKEM